MVFANSFEASATIDKLLLLISLSVSVMALDNGLAITPNQGWRSWNFYGLDIDQRAIEAQMDALKSKERSVDGVPTSLFDLGFKDVGIDDGWQLCGSGPDDGAPPGAPVPAWAQKGFHNKTGYPNVNTTRFPNMRALTAKAKSLGLTPGWYGNNCYCHDRNPHCMLQSNLSSINRCFEGDVQATIDFGFESVKYDGCGIQRNMSHWAELYNKTGKAVLLEDCGNDFPMHAQRLPDGSVDCPMNQFRCSDDLHPVWHSVINNLNATRAYNGGRMANGILNGDSLTGPGCWAYPDMIQTGVLPHVYSKNVGYNLSGTRNEYHLTWIEGRTHFAAWCIVSSPLVLGLDLTNKTNMDDIWPIISNKEMIQVNQQWIGDSGTLVKESNKTLHVPNCPHTGCPPKCDPKWPIPSNCFWPTFMVFKKRLPGQRTAILLLNNDNNAIDVSVSWSEVPGLHCQEAGCHVRDLYDKVDLGVMPVGFAVKGLASHDSKFIVVTDSAEYEV